MSAALDYLLHLADNALILGQRNAEWCGHGPILEEDIALSNVSLDLIGQARLLYQLAARLKGGECSEDRLAYFRDSGEFRNYTLLELPHSGPLSGYAKGSLDYATTIVRNFLYSALMALLWEALEQSADADLAAIAAKSQKEVRYHLRHSRDWLVRLGDGTDESHERMQGALDRMWRYSGELFESDSVTLAMVAAGIGPDPQSLRTASDRTLDAVLSEATLTVPTTTPIAGTGRFGRHSEHLGYLLAEMQYLHRQHPGATW